MKIRFCETCRRIVLTGFDFCPYCGACLQPSSPSGTVSESPGEGPDIASLRPSPDLESPAPVSGSGPVYAGCGDGLSVLDSMIRTLDALDAEIAELETAIGKR